MKDSHPPIQLQPEEVAECVHPGNVRFPGNHADPGRGGGMRALSSGWQRPSAIDGIGLPIGTENARGSTCRLGRRRGTAPGGRNRLQQAEAIEPGSGDQHADVVHLLGKRNDHQRSNPGACSRPRLPLSSTRILEGWMSRLRTNDSILSV